LQERTEFDVIEASDGWEAVQKAEASQPEFILLDIGLPGLSGIEAGRRIQRLCPDSKILFLSLESSPDVIAAALDLRSRGFIHKMHAHTYLLPAIEAILEGQQFVAGTPAPGDGKAGHAQRNHEVHFYPDDSTLLDSMDRFIAPALVDNNAAIVLATKSHREALAQRLTESRIDINRAADQGTYVALDAADLLAQIRVKGEPDRDMFLKGLSALVDSAAKATKLDHPRVAVFGECVALLHADGDLPAAIRLEQTGNEFLQTEGTPFLDIMCAYPLHPFTRDRHAFRNVCREHSSVCVR
jgi:DNA-binding NarL/FixJ family response regulator